MGLLNKLAGGLRSLPASQSSATVAKLGGTKLDSDGSMAVDVGRGLAVDTKGRVSVQVGNGIEIRSDGSLNIDTFGLGKPPGL